MVKKRAHPIKRESLQQDKRNRLYMATDSIQLVDRTHSTGTISYLILIPSRREVKNPSGLYPTLLLHCVLSPVPVQLVSLLRWTQVEIIRPPQSIFFFGQGGPVWKPIKLTRTLPIFCSTDSFSLVWGYHLSWLYWRRCSFFFLLWVNVCVCALDLPSGLYGAMEVGFIAP